MGFQAALLQLDPVFFQVKGQTEQEQFQRDIGFSPHEEALKLPVALKYAEGSLYLDGSIHPQKSASLCYKLLECLFSAL